jgi:hypothetical protein
LPTSIFRSEATLSTTAGFAPCGMQQIEYASCVLGMRRSSTAWSAPKVANELRRKDAQVAQNGLETP